MKTDNHRKVILEMKNYGISWKQVLASKMRSNSVMTATCVNLSWRDMSRNRKATVLCQTPFVHGSFLLRNTFCSTADTQKLE